MESLLCPLAARLGAVVVALVLLAGCKKSEATAPPSAPGLAGEGSAAPSQVGSAAAPSSSAPLAAPGPAALPCTSDAMCMAHRCNVQAGRCAFPCESDADCVPGNYCFKSAISACLPKPPGQPTAQ